MATAKQRVMPWSVAWYGMLFSKSLGLLNCYQQLALIFSLCWSRAQSHSAVRKEGYVADLLGWVTFANCVATEKAIGPSCITNTRDQDQCEIAKFSNIGKWLRLWWSRSGSGCKLCSNNYIVWRDQDQCEITNSVTETTDWTLFWPNQVLRWWASKFFIS